MIGGGGGDGPGGRGIGQVESHGGHQEKGSGDEGAGDACSGAGGMVTHGCQLPDAAVRDAP